MTEAPKADMIRDAVLAGQHAREGTPAWQLREYALVLHGAHLALLAVGRMDEAKDLYRTVEELRRES